MSIYFHLYSKLITQRTIILLSIFYLLTPNKVYPQIYNHRVYVESDGLINSNITDITQASDGTIWVSTVNGVSQYNGSNWINFPSTEYNLPRGEQTQIRSLTDGTIWVSGIKNNNVLITYWDGTQWNSFDTPFDVFHVPLYQLGNRYYTVSFDVWQSNNQWKIALGGSSIYEFDSQRNQWQLKAGVNDIKKSFDYIGELKYDSEGTLWVASFKGLRIIKGDTWKSIEWEFKEKYDPRIYSIAFSKQENTPYLLGKDWLGTIRNNYIQLVTTYTNNNFAKSSSFVSLNILQNRDIIYNNNSPSYLFTKGKIKRVLFDHILQNVVEYKSTYIDKENNIWIGTSRGLIKLNNRNFTNYNKFSGLIDDEVSAITQSKVTNKIILGSNIGFSIFHNSDSINQYIFSGESTLDKIRILRILIGQDGTQYFIANKKGLGILKKGKKIKWITPPNIEQPVISEAFFYSNNLYIICGSTIYKLNSDYSSTYVLKNEGNIRKVEILPNGRVLMLANTILEFKDEKLTEKYALTDYYNESIYGVCKWNNQLLVATRQGLQAIEGDSIRPTILNNYKIEDPVYALLVDSKENLWVGTAKGIYHFQKNKVEYHNTEDGLIGNEINRNALIEDNEGKIWIGTDKGVSIFSYDTEKNKSIPLVKFKSIKTDEGKELNHQTEIVLEAHENDLEFSFLGVSFINEDAINYRYKLNGHDENWLYYPSNDFTKVRYTNLKYGQYQFELQARNNNDEWSKSLISGVIHIEQPFLQSPYFYLIIILCTLSIGIIIQTFITQKNIQKALKKKVAEKVLKIESSEEELREKNEELTTLNEELDKFVYSVSHDLKSPLNSVKGLVEVIGLSNSDVERKDFLKMMDVSIDRLRNFIDDLEAYARNKRAVVEPTNIEFNELVKSALENIRYSNEAQEVSVSFNINQQEVFISDFSRISIIINNFLSNGIRYRKEYIDDAFVNININVDNSTASIVVEDNGIGIPKDRIDKIFNMFEKGGNTVKGSSGLGLFIVKETVEKLKGKISVESQVNQGSKFIVIIPSLN